MALAKSSESPLQNELKIFVDDQKLKKLCVSTRYQVPYSRVHMFFC